MGMRPPPARYRPPAGPGPGPRHEPDVELFLIGAALKLVVLGWLLFFSPLLLPLAVGLVIVADRRGWPNWPLVVYAAVVAAASYAVGTETVWDFHYRPQAELLEAIDAGVDVRRVALQRAPAWIAHHLPVATGAGALLAAGWRTWQSSKNPVPELNANWARKNRRQTARRTRRATKAAAKAPDGTRKGAGVLGAVIDGQLAGWQHRKWLTVPEPALRLGTIVLGVTGTGKTETLLRVAWIALRYGWEVHFVDGKGDRDAAARVAGMAAAAGMDPGQVKVFPDQPFDGWRGDPAALRNRLMAVIDYSETYYRDVAQIVLDLALQAPGTPTPAGFADLLERMNRPALAAAWRDVPAQAATVDTLDKNGLAGAHNRYRAFQAAVAGKLDGTWSWEDATVSYLGLDGISFGAETAALGRFLIEDFGHYASRRKPHGRRALLIIDEFSALQVTHAAGLLERLRGFNASLVVASQSVEGLHHDANTTARLLNAAGGPLICHRLADPEAIAERAGTIRRPEVAHQLDAVGYTGLGSLRIQDTFRVPPDQLRQLARGQAIIIAGGQAAHTHIARAPTDHKAARQIEHVQTAERRTTGRVDPTPEGRSVHEPRQGEPSHGDQFDIPFEP